MALRIPLHIKPFAPIITASILITQSLTNASPHPVPIANLYGTPLIPKSPSHLYLPQSPNISIHQYDKTFLIFQALDKTELSIKSHSHTSPHNSKHKTTIPITHPLLTISVHKGCLFINHELTNLQPRLQIITSANRVILPEKSAQYIITPHSITKITPPSTPKVRLLFASCHNAYQSSKKLKQESQR